MTTPVLDFLLAARPAFLDDLAALVNVDCGTANKAGVDRVGEWVRARCVDWGAAVEHFPQSQYGDCWLARWRGSGQGRVLLIGHLDTVYPEGVAAQRPLRRVGERLLGPGVCDMKSGLLAGLYAVRALLTTGFTAFEELAFFFNSDEEVGSPASRAASGPAARSMDAALVLEAGRVNGDIVSARKGSGEFRLTVTGRAAHAGVEPEKGVNAVLELAHQIVALHRLNGLAPGVTVNAGVVGGGTASNVIPAEAWVDVDVRAVDPAGAQAITRALNALSEQVTVPGAQVAVRGQFSYPPLAKTPAGVLLARLARDAAQLLGFDVKDAATGGASDANWLAGLGLPVLDGLGPVGGLDHSPDEYIELESIVPRTALVAGLLQEILAPHHLQALRQLRDAQGAH